MGRKPTDRHIHGQGKHYMPAHLSQAGHKKGEEGLYEFGFSQEGMGLFGKGRGVEQ